VGGTGTIPALLVNANHLYAVVVSMLEAFAAARTTAGVNLRTLLLPAPLSRGTAIVEGDEAHHGRVVLRLRAGEDIRVADGEGHAAPAVVTGVGRTALEIEVAEPETLPASTAELLTVAFAVPKGDRFADLVRGLTELGVGRLLPLRCERGERVPGNLDRVGRIAAESLKQCQRPRLPVIGPVVGLEDLAAEPGVLVICDPYGAPAAPGTATATTLLIGPEGGFTAEELALLPVRTKRVRLAASILRIETAALAAASVWVAAWEGAA